MIADARISRRHAVLWFEDGRWVLADNGSANGIYAGDQRVLRIEIVGVRLLRLSHPQDGLLLSFSVAAASRHGSG